MDALREATEKLKLRRKKKSRKDKMSSDVSLGKWTLVDEEGKPLQLTSVSYTVGRGTGTDINIQDDSVDQTHAFINFNQERGCFQVIDLSTDTGTYVNGSRIPAQHPVSLQSKDTLRFGTSLKSYSVESSRRMSDSESLSQIEEVQEQKRVLEVTTMEQQQHRHSQHLVHNNSSTPRKDTTVTQHLVHNSSTPRKDTTVTQHQQQAQHPPPSHHHQHGTHFGGSVFYKGGMQGDSTSSRSAITSSGSGGEVVGKTTAGYNLGRKSVPVTMATTGSRSPTVQRSRPRTTEQGESQLGKYMENGSGSSGTISEKQDVALPAWAMRQEAGHIFAECPGCIAEQEIRHTCGGQEEGSSTSLPPHSVAHNHPEISPHPPSQHQPHPSQQHTHPSQQHPPPVQGSWEEPPPHFHHPPYPTVDYRTYNPASPRAEFSGDEYLYPPTSHGYSPAHHFPPPTTGERRSHEASESQLKRSKSAQFPYETQGFVPYTNISRDPYHYPYQPSGYPTHSYHPPPPLSHLHGYYPSQATSRPPPPVYTHYPSKAMYHGCKTCSSFMAKYGQVPREHLHHHAIAKPEISQEDASFPPPLPRQPPPVVAAALPDNNGIQDTSPSNQGYGSQAEKMESMESSTINTSDNKFDETVSDKTMDTGQACCDTEALDGNGMNYVSTLSTTVTSIVTDQVSQAQSQFDTQDTLSSDVINNVDVDFIPERDTNWNHQLSHSQDVGDCQGNIKSGTELSLEVSHDKKSELYDQSAWWGDTKRLQGLSADLGKPVSIDISLTSSDPTHTPPERDTGPNDPLVQQGGDEETGYEGVAVKDKEEWVSEHSEKSARTRFDHTEDSSFRPVCRMVKSASIDVAELTEVRDSKYNRNQQEETSVQHGNLPTSAMSSDSPTAVPLIKPYDSLSSQIESLSFNKALDNQDPFKPVIATSLSSEPRVPTNQASESSVVSTSQAFEPSVHTGQTSEPPIPTSQLSEAPGVPTTKATEPSVSTNQASEPPVPTNQASEPTVSTSQACEPPASKSQASEPPVPARRGSSMAFTIDLGDDAPAKPSAMTAATAFTVDMGIEEVAPGTKKIAHSDSLSNFLPPKLRKSFKDRASKAKSEKEDRQGIEGTGNESESHLYTSPLAKRRGVVGPGTKASRSRTGYHSDGTHSAMSSDNEEYSIHSERTSAARKSLPPRPTQPNNQRPRHRPKPENSHSRTMRVLEGMSVEKKLEQRMLRSKSTGFTKASSVDDYLNSMEHCDDHQDENIVVVMATAAKSEREEVGERESINPPPEYVLYKEAKHYDSIIQSNSTGKRKEDGGKKPRVNTTSRSLNVPRTGAEDEDNLSETGTYTIEIDKDEQSARQSIETVFNVSDRLESLRLRSNSGYTATTTRHLPQPAKGKGSYVDSSHRVASSDSDINGNFQELEAGRAKAHHMYVVDSMDAEVGSALSASQREPPTEHKQQEQSNFYVTAIAPNSSMIRHQKTDLPTELDKSQELHLLQTSLSSTSPHSQGTRSRPRRKLPTPPVKAQGDAASPRTPRTTNTEVDVDSPGRHRGSVTYNNDDDGGSSFTVSFDAPQKHEIIMPRDDESVVSSIFSQSGQSLVTKVTEVVVGGGHAALDSARSVGTLDTEVLLEDTELVMQVLEKQKYMRKDSLDDDDEEFDSSRYSPVPKDELCLTLDRDSDSEASSTNAVIEEIVPRGYAEKSTGDLPKSHNKLHKSRESYKGKPFSIKDRALGGLKGKTSKRLSSSSADFDHFVGTDDSENETSSFASTGTDYSNMAQSSRSSPKFQRQGSTGKGSIAHTRTNRTFALRRGVADGSDSESARTDTARSTRSEKSTPRTRSRPSSAKESIRTDAGLGTKIVHKSRDNVKTSSKETKDPSLTRKDGGRFSLRSSKSAAVSSAPKVSESKTKKKSDVATPRSGRLSTGSLSASGNTPKSSHPPSKSKKADEYQAWQRRNKYDPRKAVADAKAKDKRTRSVGNTPEFAETRPRGETMDSVSSEELQIDEITKLSSAVANDLNLMTSQVKQENEVYTDEYTEVRSSAFKSVTSSHTNGSAFKSPVKNTSSPLYSPVPIKGHTSTQYDPVLVSSIQQLSSQLKSQTHRIMDRLSEERGTDSVCVEDLMGETVEDASPELSSTLSNLRNTELLLRVLERELFSESEEVSLQESHRLRDEAGFRPIPQPVHSREPGKTKKLVPTGSSSSSSSKKSSRVMRSSHSQESRVTYPSTEYY